MKKFVLFLLVGLLTLASCAPSAPNGNGEATGTVSSADRPSDTTTNLDDLTYAGRSTIPATSRLAPNSVPDLVTYKLPEPLSVVYSTNKDGSIAQIPNEDAAKLASLTKEDGTGTIHLGMLEEEIAAVLDRLHIRYMYYNGVVTENGSIYVCSGADGRLEIIHAAQTNKGLKIGDPIGKAKELYGEPKTSIEPRGADALTQYYYEFNDMNSFVVSSHGGFNAPVDSIQINIIPSWAKEGNAAAR